MMSIICIPYNISFVSLYALLLSHPTRVRGLKYRWPHEYLELERNERAFVAAAIQIKIENDKKEARKIRK